VKVSRVTPDGRQVVVDIYQADDFFGEWAFVANERGTETAIALENTKTMSWTVAEIEEIAARKPKLGLSLVQFLVKRSMDFAARIESFSVDNISRRLVRSLLRFSERMGEAAEDGEVRMIPFTHELLAQYVGTSREIVTQYMNQFRRKGVVRYSRRGIALDRAAAETWLAGDN
jgi:CRP/FNR family transcriptional regulator, cyclic AMP receptor protein